MMFVPVSCANQHRTRNLVQGKRNNIPSVAVLESNNYHWNFDWRIWCDKWGNQLALKGIAGGKRWGAGGTKPIL